jgi:site-specific DNA recombinase
MAGTAAIYARISNDRESTELGVERQEKLCRRLAAQLEVDVVDVFIDNDTSASTISTKARPRYDEMLRRARLGEFSMILAYSNSRLTRRVREYLDIIDLAKQYSVRVHTVQSGTFNLNTADGQAVATTIAAWDQAEAERTSERIKAAKAQRAEKGEWHGGTPPFGYRSANTKLVENPRESALVHEAARRILEGDSMHSIVADWNSQKITTRFGKHWRQSNLRTILTNRSLLGETKAGVIGWEPILDQRTFDRLARLFSDPARKATHSPGVKGGKYAMGGGVAVCGVCGNRLITGGKRTEPWNKDSPIRPILKCTSVVNGPTACNSVVVDHDRLEAFVFETLIVSFESSERWHQRLGEKDPEVDSKIDALEAQLTNLREQQSRVNDLYIAGEMDRLQHAGHVQRVRDETTALQRQRDALLGKPLLSRALESGIESWRDWPPMKRRSFLKQVVARVEVGRWPEGTARTLGRRRGESDESLRERRDAHLLEVMKKRASIVF